jgi:hypothetical protein
MLGTTLGDRPRPDQLLQCRTAIKFLENVGDRTDSGYFALAKFLYRQLSDTGVWRLRV